VKDEKKKGILSAIWDSMVKSGGCWGPEKNCGGSADDDSKENTDVKEQKNNKK